MKRINIFILLLFLLFSCKNKVVMTNPSEIIEYVFSADSVYLYFLGGFSNDTMEIDYAGTHIKRDNVTTDESIGLAMVQVLPIIEYDTIRIKKLNTVQDINIVIADTCLNQIGVWFDSDKNRMQYILKKEPFRFE